MKTLIPCIAYIFKILYVSIDFKFRFYIKSNRYVHSKYYIFIIKQKVDGSPAFGWHTGWQKTSGWTCLVLETQWIADSHIPIQCPAFLPLSSSSKQVSFIKSYQWLMYCLSWLKVFIHLKIYEYSWHQEKESWIISVTVLTVF